LRLSLRVCSRVFTAAVVAVAVAGCRLPMTFCWAGHRSTKLHDVVRLSREGHLQEGSVPLPVQYSRSIPPGNRVQVTTNDKY
jgi:hypothetical protein